jgi:hypothetical protein
LFGGFIAQNLGWRKCFLIPVSVGQVQPSLHSGLTAACLQRATFNSAHAYSHSSASRRQSTRAGPSPVDANVRSWTSSCSATPRSETAN